MDATTVDDAARWVARLRSEDCSSDDWRDFCDWREKNDGNRDAFDSYMALWSSLGEVEEEPEIVRLRLEALASDVEPVTRPAWHKAVAACLGIFALVGLGSLLTWSSPQSDPARQTHVAIEERAVPPDKPASEYAARKAPDGFFESRYTSAIGQRSRVSLPDGSTLELNTDTAVAVNFTPQRRELHLLRGEALFEVAPDASRPFIVNSNNDRVIALGTVFSVRETGDKVVVSLVEGHVQVDHLTPNQPQQAQSIRLRPGEQAVGGVTRGFTISKLDAETTLSWRTGRVVFADKPLRDVVTELNRYSVKKLVIGDPGLADQRVSGAFTTGSAEKFAAALSVAVPLTVSRDAQSGNMMLNPVKQRPADQ